MTLEALRTAFDAETYPRREPDQLKRFAELWIRRALDAIKAEGRGPDDWESVYLAAALGGIVMHQHVRAAHAVRLAMAPPGERMCNFRGTTYRAVSLRDLLNGLDCLSKLPARIV